MRYSKFLSLGLLGCTGLIFSQYITPGNGSTLNLDNLVSASAGVVTKVNNTYRISNDLTISTTDTLKITTDETIVVDSAKTVTFKGAFLAKGVNGITVLPKDSSNILSTYREFRFENGSAKLKRINFLYGGGLKIMDSMIEIDSCILRGTSKKYNSSAISASTSTVKVYNSIIANSQRAAIGSASNSTMVFDIRNNLLKTNSTTSENYPQINLGPGLANDTIRIIGNTIEGQYIKAGAIAISNLLGGGGKTNYIIDKNIIKNNRYGITAVGKNIYGIISRNTIEGNNIQNIPNQGGSGISLQLTSTNAADTLQKAVIKNNIIKNNLWGITVIGRARATLAEGYNEITDNGNTGVTYNLYNNTIYPISAQNNYWGFAEAAQIEGTIFHKPDVDSLGLVTFTPFLTASEIGAENKIVSEILTSSYPNPFNPETTISYELKNGSFTQLAIYNAKGEMLKVLAAGVHSAGKHSVKFNAAGLASGLYFYRVSTPNQSVSRKILLNK